MSAPTLESTLDYIHKFYPHLNRKKSKSKKSTNPPTVCSICYLKLIEKINPKTIPKIIFLYRSIRQHYINVHPTYGNITPKSRGLFYFVIEDDKVTNTYTTLHDVLEEMNDRLPPDNANINEVVPPSNVNNTNINISDNTSPMFRIDQDNDESKSNATNESNDTTHVESAIASMESLLSPENYNYLDAKFNEILKILPEMESRLGREVQKLVDHTALYQQKLKNEIELLKEDLKHNKLLSKRRNFNMTDYDDYLLFYSQDGFMYEQNEELESKNIKHGWCSICDGAPDLQSVSFGKGGRPTGDLNIATEEAQDEFEKYGRGLYRHYIDPDRSKKHRMNKLKLQGLIDDPMIVVFANLSRCFARVLTMGCGYIMYESFVEDIYYSGGLIGDQYHCYKFCDFLLLQFFAVRLDDLAMRLNNKLPCTKRIPPISLTTDKSTDAAGTHEEQLIAYVDDECVKTVAEIGVVHLSNNKDDITTQGTADGLSASWIKSLTRMRYTMPLLRYVCVSICNDAEYDIKNVQNTFVEKIKSALCLTFIDPSHDICKLLEKVMDQLLPYLVNKKAINFIHSWIGPKTKRDIQSRTKEIKNDKRIHGLNPFVDTRFVDHAQKTHENIVYHHNSIDYIAGLEYEKEKKSTRKQKIQESRNILNSKYHK
eukprot:294395_1